MANEPILANDRRRRFDALMLPHLDAALNLARWLSRSGQDAEDIVQEAYLRAYRSFDGFHGDRPKPWLLAIVRNCHRDEIAKLRDRRIIPLEELQAKAGDAGPGFLGTMASDDDSPEVTAIRNNERARLDAAIASLPIDYREVLVLREIEDLSYREIAEIAGVPLGTVMSRLARARGLLRSAWLGDQANERAS